MHPIGHSEQYALVHVFLFNYLYYYTKFTLYSGLDSLGKGTRSIQIHRKPPY